MTAPTLRVEYPSDRERTAALQSMSAAAAVRLAAAWTSLATAQDAFLATLARAVRRDTRLTAAQLRRAAAQFATATAAFDRDAMGVVAGWAARDLPIAYRDGALGALRYSSRTPAGWQWTTGHQAAIGALSAGFYADLTRRVTETVRRAQAFARALVAAARSAAVPDVDALRDEHPLGTVVYANQARHPADSWARSALIAQATTAANSGTLRTAGDDLGCEWVQIIDGPECGWVGHDDTDQAHGTLRSIDEAAAYPIAHPGCVRELVPRPDLTGVPGIEEGQQA